MNEPEHPADRDDRLYHQHVDAIAEARPMTPSEDDS